MSFASHEGDPTKTSSGAEQLLTERREAIIRRAQDRLDEARGREMAENIVYVFEAPLDTPEEEVEGILLTKEGRMPFRNDQLTERLWIYFPKGVLDLVWIEDYQDGVSEKFSLTPSGLAPTETVEDALAALNEETTVEPSEGDMVELLRPDFEYSATERLSFFAEKLERYLLTPTQDEQAKHA